MPGYRCNEVDTLPGGTLAMMDISPSGSMTIRQGTHLRLKASVTRSRGPKPRSDRSESPLSGDGPQAMVLLACPRFEVVYGDTHDLAGWRDIWYGVYRTLPLRCLRETEGGRGGLVAGFDRTGCPLSRGS